MDKTTCASKDGLVCPYCGSTSLRAHIEAAYEYDNGKFHLNPNCSQEKVTVASLSPGFGIQCTDCNKLCIVSDAMEAYQSGSEPELKNTNFLKGFKCPKCGELEPFVIRCSVTASFFDDGCDEYEDTEWENDSLCHCESCGHNGVVEDFLIENQSETPEGFKRVRDFVFDDSDGLSMLSGRKIVCPNCLTDNRWSVSRLIRFVPTGSGCLDFDRKTSLTLNLDEIEATDEVYCPCTNARFSAGNLLVELPK